jgi:hypothetical protein
MLAADNEQSYADFSVSEADRNQGGGPPSFTARLALRTGDARDKQIVRYAVEQERLRLCKL